MTAGRFRSLLLVAALGLISGQASAQGQHPASFPGQGFSDSCNSTFCSWDDFAPTEFAFGLTINTPESLKPDTYIACHSCLHSGETFLVPPGLSFKGPNDVGNSDDEHGKSGDAHGGAPVNTLADVTTTPEPATVALMATGLLGLIPVIRRRRRD